jgi:hypothetical protein
MTLFALGELGYIGRKNILPMIPPCRCRIVRQMIFLMMTTAPALIKTGMIMGIGWGRMNINDLMAFDREVT